MIITEAVTLHQIELTSQLGWFAVCDASTLSYLNKYSAEFDREVSSLISYSKDNPLRNEFRWFVEISSIQYSVAIYPETKEVLIGSKNLSREMLQISLFGKEVAPEVDSFIKFVKRIASIPVENSPTTIEFLSHHAELPLFNEGKFEAVHERAHQLSETLVKKVKSYNQSFFEKFSDYGLGLTANYMLIRIHLLKFLAILPNLDHDIAGEEVKRIFLESLRRLVIDSKKAKIKELSGQKKPLPNYIIAVLSFVEWISRMVPEKFLARVLRFSVSVLARRFIAGTDIVDARKSLKELLDSGRGATIDQLGELVVSNAEADEYTEKVISIIKGLSEQIPKGQKNSAGINEAHVSIKVSALCNDFKPHDFEYSFENIAPRLKKILTAGKDESVFINIDAEHYHYRDLVLEIYGKVLLNNLEFENWDQTGIVVQAYLRDGIKHLYDVIELAKKRNVLIPIRLVKGAYWDAETIEAQAHNFTPPQFLNKEETDIHFRQLIYKSLENENYIQLAIASHNLQDHCFGQALREKFFPSAPLIEHQCLHMTYEGLSVGLSKMGWATRNYIPVGNLLVGMAYLVRRIMENSSQVGVLTIMRSHKTGLERKTPTQKLKLLKRRGGVTYDESISNISADFKNIFPIRTYRKDHLDNTLKFLYRDLSNIRGGELYYSGGNVKVPFSSDPKYHLGEIDYTPLDAVDIKMEALFKNFSEKTTDKSLRVFKMLRLSDLMLQSREEITSLIMIEAGKTLDEAIADVDEAIDFINFYVREQIKLDREEHRAAKGVVGVIAPWNFPLAIACGMSVAPYIAGNNVILKPSEHTSIVGIKYSELLREAGVLEDELCVVYGAGEVGSKIVEHELLAGVIFTGSKKVGQQIYKKVSGSPISPRYNKNAVKFAITEMGGKNGIIVTNNSELDETVSGVIYSAFAHSGQKCSAASRVIIDEKLKDAFIKRFREAVKDIKVGPSYELSSVINPLISKNDQVRVKSLAKEARGELKGSETSIIIDRSEECYDSFCVGPAVFCIDKGTDIPIRDTVANKEVFGPIVHLITYSNIDEAIEIFNDTQYALTGGIYCQSQDDIDYITPKLEAGNIYINRPNTGARVAIEPFGGFKLSGTGPKAGSTQYLLEFSTSSSHLVETKMIISDPKSLEQSFEITNTSGLAQMQRVEKVESFLEALMGQYNSYINYLNEGLKAEFSEQVEQVMEHFKVSEISEFENQYIPGQLSFDKKTLNVGNIILIDSQHNINPQTLLVVIINLLAGNGVNIISTNQNNFQDWERMYSLIFNNGISSYNFKLDFLSIEEIENILEKESFNSVTFSSFECYGKLRECFIRNSSNDWIIKAYLVENNIGIDEMIDRYVHRRSFAINTMRHGAPLELTI